MMILINYSKVFILPILKMVLLTGRYLHYLRFFLNLEARFKHIEIEYQVCFLYFRITFLYHKPISKYLESMAMI